ncbi:MAG TPA: alpha/beta hydrolase-fold protein [Ktedonobacterales bacterium]|nr:alpha/beta hydrolase-fold protein [Ktedonobacterales bacterium]
MTRPTPAEGLPLVHLVRPPLVAPPEGQKPPLLSLAHGVGSNERDLFSFADQLDPRFVVVSARAPLTRGPDSYAWFNVQFLPTGFAITEQHLDTSRKVYAEFVAAAAQAYGADPARIYTLGFSQGAIISLVTALSHPGVFAGVVAMSGRIPPEAEPWLASPEETAGLPVFVSHGIYDNVIGIELARAARVILERQRADLTYQEYPANHHISPEMFSDMTAWVAARLG